MKDYGLRWSNVRLTWFPAAFLSKIFHWSLFVYLFIYLRDRRRDRHRGHPFADLLRKSLQKPSGSIEFNPVLLHWIFVIWSLKPSCLPPGVHISKELESRNWARNGIQVLYQVRLGNLTRSLNSKANTHSWSLS